MVGKRGRKGKQAIQTTAILWNKIPLKIIILAATIKMRDHKIQCNL
jgi:hypothetical protein